MQVDEAFREIAATLAAQHDLLKDVSDALRNVLTLINQDRERLKALEVRLSKIETRLVGQNGAPTPIPDPPEDSVS